MLVRARSVSLSLKYSSKACAGVSSVARTGNAVRPLPLFRPGLSRESCEAAKEIFLGVNDVCRPNTR